MEIRAKATTAYQAAGNIYVNNSCIAEQRENYKAVESLSTNSAARTEKSIFFFDQSLNLVFFNNPWLTLPPGIRPQNVDDVIHALSPFYMMAGKIAKHVNNTAATLQSCTFSLHRLFTGGHITCQCSPVFTDFGLIGFILIAAKDV